MNFVGVSASMVESSSWFHSRIKHGKNEYLKLSVPARMGWTRDVVSDVYGDLPLVPDTSRLVEPQWIWEYYNSSHFGQLGCSQKMSLNVNEHHEGWWQYWWMPTLAVDRYRTNTIQSVILLLYYVLIKYHLWYKLNFTYCLQDKKPGA